MSLRACHKGSVQQHGAFFYERNGAYGAWAQASSSCRLAQGLHLGATGCKTVFLWESFHPLCLSPGGYVGEKSRRSRNQPAKMEWSATWNFPH